MLYKYLLPVLLLLKYINCSEYEYIKSVKLDYFYEIKLEEYNGRSSINIKDIYNQTIITVSSDAYNELLYTGSGKLPNGKIINIYKKDKFEYIDSKYKYTLGSNNNELIPYRSISTNIFKFGTYIYIKDYEKIGLGNITHDGCFRVDDNNKDNNRITIFTGDTKTYNKNINKTLKIYKNICTF